MASDSAHHLYGPSSLKRRYLCPGSARMEKDLPDVSSPDAEEGTRLHALVANALESGTVPEDETAAAAVDKIRSLLPEGAEVHAEYPLAFSFCDEEQFRGTADVVAVCPDKVIIIDLKTGRRNVDDARDNLQLAAYALAAMQTFRKDTATVHIVNPVIGQYSEYTHTDWSALIRVIMGIIAQGTDPDAPIVPGEEQCRYCKAAHFGTCPALAKVTAVTTLTAEELVPLPRLDYLSPAELCELKAKCDLVARLGERIDARIRTVCEESGRCGCWELKETSGGRELTDIQEAFKRLGMDSNSFLSCCSASVAKLEKLYARSLKESGKFSTEKEGKALFAETLAELILERPRKKNLTKTK